MRRIHAQRVAEAFGYVLGSEGRIERPRCNVWRVSVEVDGIVLVFEDVDEACDYLVSRWWL